VASRDEVEELLNILTCDAKTIPDLYYHFASDPDKRRRMVAVGNLLKKADILHKPYTDKDIYLWNRSFFTAYTRRIMRCGEASSS
jgi:hypothetical protein